MLTAPNATQICCKILQFSDKLYNKAFKEHGNSFLC